MNHSPEIGKLAGALAKAQANIKAAAFDRVNPHFKNKYATLNSVIDAIRAELTANEIAVIQGTDTASDGALVCETMLVHSSGEWIKSALRLYPRDNGAQSVGSALTYGRRYLLAAMTCNASDEDDDANAATGSKPPDKASTRAQTTQDKPKAEAPVKERVAEKFEDVTPPAQEFPKIPACSPAEALEISRLCKALGLTDKAEIRRRLSLICGREIASASALSAEEAKMCIFRLNDEAVDIKEEKA